MAQQSEPDSVRIGLAWSIVATSPTTLNATITGLGFFFHLTLLLESSTDKEQNTKT
jgi:hypothetical protein